MPRITLTDLVDVVMSSGVPKATKVAQIMSRGDYEPQFDFYKQLREAIQNLHQVGAPKSDLDKVKLQLSDKKKQGNYPDAIKGYKKWLGKKNVKWFKPPRDDLSIAGVDVSVNPELGLRINGDRHIVKLYFKADKLTKRRTDVITCAMEDALRSSVKPDDLMTVVDVRRGKHFSGAGPSTKLSGMLGAELAYIAYFWSNS